MAIDEGVQLAKDAAKDQIGIIKAENKANDARNRADESFADKRERIATDLSRSEEDARIARNRALADLEIKGRQ